MPPKSESPQSNEELQEAIIFSRVRKYLRESLKAWEQSGRPWQMTQKQIDELVQNRSGTFLNGLQKRDPRATFATRKLEGVPPHPPLLALKIQSIYNNEHWILAYIQEGHKVTLKVYHSVTS